MTVRTIFDQKYKGWTAFQGWKRDVIRALEDWTNLAPQSAVPWPFKGTMQIIIQYKEAPKPSYKQEKWRILSRLEQAGYEVTDCKLIDTGTVEDIKGMARVILEPCELDLALIAKLLQHIDYHIVATGYLTGDQDKIGETIATACKRLEKAKTAKCEGNYIPYNAQGIGNNIIYICTICGRGETECRSLRAQST